MEEESAKRKERFQSMRMEVGQINKDPGRGKESLQSAPGLVSNSLVDSSVTSISHNSPRFDYYTDPLAANKNNVITNQNYSKSVSSESPNGYPNKPRAMISPTNGSIPIGSYATQAPFGSRIFKNHFPSGPQYYGSPSSNESPLSMPPVPSFSHPSPPLLWQHQQQIQSSPQHRGFLNPNNGSPLTMSSRPRFNTWSQSSPPQSGSEPRQFYNSSNESPAFMTPDPRFSNTVLNDNFWSQQPHSPFNPASNMAGFGLPEIYSQQRHQQDQSGSQRKHMSSWLDPRGSLGGRGSPRSEPLATGSPSYGSGGRVASSSEPRGRGSGGRGQAWMNSRGRGSKFVKKTMVGDPWKNLVPIQMDSLKDAHRFGRRGVVFDLDYSELYHSESISLKKPKTSQIKDDFQSGLSLAESLALSFCDAIREESCN